MTQPNPSIAQARAMADEFARNGVSLAVISPGSRSAALAIAFEEHSAIATKVVLDERSAAFQALGHIRATGTPAVCVSTSGTAGANYLPAVVEADLSLLPLIVLTADRPPELRHVGANQTIDQVGLFGARPRWFCDVGLADGNDTNPYWRTTVCQAVGRAKGFGGRPGPVHLNVAFREPTVPVSDDGRSRAAPYPHSIEGRRSAAPWQEPRIAAPGLVDLSHLEASRGLVVMGDIDADAAGVLDAARSLGWPVLATVQSGLRGEPDVITSYHHLLVDGVPAGMAPDLVVTIGATGPSDRVGRLTGLPAAQVQIDRWGRWNDPRRQATVMVQGDPAPTLATMGSTADVDWVKSWQSAGRSVRAALDAVLEETVEPTGPGLARALSTVAWQSLVVSSSMPIRDVDAHTVGGGRVHSNRGASGIDGFLSTAIGVAHGAGSGTLAIAGDLSFLHDLSALVGDERADLVILAVDNHGGGLFDLLPHAAHAPAFERLFVATHTHDLTAVSLALGVEATASSSVAEARQQVGDRLTAGGLHVVEVEVDRESDLKMRQVLDEAARGAVANLSA